MDTVSKFLKLISLAAHSGWAKLALAEVKCDAPGITRDAQRSVGGAVKIGIANLQNRLQPVIRQAEMGLQPDHDTRVER